MPAAADVQIPSLSLFFPCHNEAGTVVQMTEACLCVARRVARDYEVIIVDDGSTDATGERADELAAKYPDEVRAVHNRPNRGYGGALQTGFHAARKDWIFYTDGDMQFDVEEIDRLLALLGEFQIVSAYRVDRKDRFLRRLNGACWSWLVRRAFRLRLRDIDCAFKVYPKRFIDAVELLSEGALIDAEMLARATRAGFRIGQVGVHHYPRTVGDSSGGNWRVIARAFKELLSLRRAILRVPREGPEPS